MIGRRVVGLILSYKRRQQRTFPVIAPHGNRCLHKEVVSYPHPLPQRFSAHHVTHAVADDTNSVVGGKFRAQALERRPIHKGTTLTPFVFAGIEWPIRFASVPSERGKVAFVS